MELRRTTLKLLAAALVSSIVAGSVLYKAGDAFLQHARLRASVAQQEREYQAQLEELGQVLHEGEQMQSDEKAQEQMLIDRYGYTRPDETPIVIMDDQDG